MFVSSKRSRPKTVHFDHCFYVNRIAQEHLQYFYTTDEAYRAGYHLCQHCSPVIKAYKQEKQQLQAFCKRYQLRLKVVQGLLKINDGMDKWLIVYSSEKKRLQVFHKNRIANIKDAKDKSILAGYHLQRIRFTTLLEALESIRDHLFRYLDGDKRHLKTETIARRVLYGGDNHNKSHRKRMKEERKQKRAQRRSAIANVLSLLESLECEEHSALC